MKADDDRGGRKVAWVVLMLAFTPVKTKLLLGTLPLLPSFVTGFYNWKRVINSLMYLASRFFHFIYRII